MSVQAMLTPEQADERLHAVAHMAQEGALGGILLGRRAPERRGDHATCEAATFCGSHMVQTYLTVEQSGCRFPREVRPVPLHLRPCSADPAPTLQNRLITCRPLRHDARIGAGLVELSAGSAHLARNTGASRVE